MRRNAVILVHLKADCILLSPSAPSDVHRNCRARLNGKNLMMATVGELVHLRHTMSGGATVWREFTPPMFELEVREGMDPHLTLAVSEVLNLPLT
jgi:hypothetical protein